MQQRLTIDVHSIELLKNLQKYPTEGNLARVKAYRPRAPHVDGTLDNLERGSANLRKILNSVFEDNLEATVRLDRYNAASRMVLEEMERDLENM